MAGNPLEALSDNDLQALKAGKLDLVSDTGLMALKDFQAVKGQGNVQKPPKPFKPSGETALTAGEEVLANPYGRAAVGMAKPVIGLGQLGLNAIGQGEGINRSMADLAASTGKAREYVGSTGLDLADMTGQGAAMAVPAGMVGPAATTTGRIGQGMLFGGAAGAAETVSNPDDYWGQKGAQIGLGTLAGGLVPGLWEGGKAVGRGVRNVAQPYMGQWGADKAAGRLADQIAGDKSDEIINLMRQSQPIVPGSNPTAGQAAVPANRAEFNALQKIASEKAPSDYVGPLGIEGQQNAARLAAVRTVGRTPTELSAAQSARAADAKVNYETAGKILVEADGNLNQLLKRPSMDKVLTRAKELAAERDRPFMIGQDVPEQTISGRIVGESGSPLSSYTVAAQKAKFPVESLHDVKMAMDDLIKNPERFGIGAAEAKAIQGTQRQFVTWLGKKAEPYEFARSQYAAASKPINQMQIGQYLENKLTPALSEDAKQRAATFSQALRDAPGTLKRATGEQRYDSMGQIMRPDQLETFRNVQSDLARGATDTELARGGNKAAMEIIDKNVGKAPPSGMFSPVISVARGAYNRIAGGASEKTLQDLATIMQDPKKMADVMQKAKPYEREQIIDILMRMQAGFAQDLANEGGALAKRKPRGALSR